MMCKRADTVKSSFSERSYASLGRRVVFLSCCLSVVMLGTETVAVAAPLENAEAPAKNGHTLQQDVHQARIAVNECSKVLYNMIIELMSLAAPKARVNDMLQVKVKMAVLADGLRQASKVGGLDPDAISDLKESERV